MMYYTKVNWLCYRSTVCICMYRIGVYADMAASKENFFSKNKVLRDPPNNFPFSDIGNTKYSFSSNKKNPKREYLGLGLTLSKYSPISPQLCLNYEKFPFLCYLLSIWCPFSLEFQGSDAPFCVLSYLLGLSLPLSLYL